MTATPRDQMAQPWHAQSAAAVLQAMGTAQTGLDPEERTSRLAEYGPNELEVARSDPRWLTLLKQFRSPMILFLLVAAVVTSVMQEWVDTAAILVALVLNAVIGYWQERKAARDVQALRSLSTPTARVLTEGKTRLVQATTVVPGDLVRLESGDRVPADLRLVEATGLRLDESMLTGEVLAVDKGTEPVDETTPMAERTSLVYAGTLVVSGRALGVTVATGRSSELGEINELVQTSATKTPLQVLTDRMEKTIAVVIASVAALLFVLGLLLGNSPAELFRTVVALIVSAMPEALPIVLTVAMGVGVSRMAARNAVVRHLPSVETLGSTTVIGSDKTGTLTENRLTVEALWTADGHRDLTGPEAITAAAHELSARECAVARAGALSNEARFRTRRSETHEKTSTSPTTPATAQDPTGPGPRDLVGDAVDVAMASFALRTHQVTTEQIIAGPVREMPYEPHLQFSQAVVTEPDGSLVLYVKGAPEKVLAFCDRIATADGVQRLDAEWREDVTRANVEMGAEGLRVIATACRRLRSLEELLAAAETGTARGGELALPMPESLILLGLEGMADPPRPGVPEAIATCRQAGMHVMMITGDHPVTAAAIGERIGLGGSGAAPLTGPELERLDDDALRERLRQTTVAARMTPQDKLRLVELIRDDGQIVAVTGDGVNDAPALKAASIGVAMGRSGTDVAREAADVVLTDDNFVTIVHAVEQGRVTFAAIRKASFFLLANATGFMLAVAVNLFTDQPLIFLPVMLLWTNIVTNGVQDIALAFEKGEGDELKQRPRGRDEGVLNPTMWWRTVVTGVWMAAGTLLVYTGALHAGYELDHARTFALTTMVMFNFFNVMNARTERRSIVTVNPLSNPLLAISAVLALGMHWGVMEWEVSAGFMGLAPLSWVEWLACFLIGATVLGLVELEKGVRRRR